MDLMEQHEAEELQQENERLKAELHGQEVAYGEVINEIEELHQDLKRIVGPLRGLTEQVQDSLRDVEPEIMGRYTKQSLQAICDYLEGGKAIPDVLECPEYYNGFNAGYKARMDEEAPSKEQELRRLFIKHGWMGDRDIRETIADIMELFSEEKKDNGLI